MLEQISNFLRNQTMLCIAILAAVITSFFASPTPTELVAAIDLRVIALLFCLMTTVAGFTKCGAITKLASSLLKRVNTTRTLYLLLVLLPFFAAMLLTNDVALLVFVPLAVTTLIVAKRRQDLAPVIVAQAVAANLGSMLTPIGNPQNLFIYLNYNVDPLEFMQVIAPFACISLLLVVARCLLWPSTRLKDEANDVAKDKLAMRTAEPAKPIPRAKFALCCALFVVSVLAVVRLVPWQASLVIVAAAVALTDHELLKHVDWALLLTFVCFFLFSENMAHISFIVQTLGHTTAREPFFTTLISSQVISNVPSAVLLSTFTQNWQALLLGVDLGGLGTPVASLASLIAFRIYRYTPDARLGTFMKPFFALNFLFLAILIACYLLIGMLP